MFGNLGEQIDMDSELWTLAYAESLDLAEHFDGLIFDCDGTLTDSMPLHYVAWKQTLDSYGVQFPEDRFYSMGGMPTDRIVAILGAEQGVALDAVQVAEEKEVAFSGCMEQLQPLGRVCDIARRFQGRLPMAVASGGMRAIVSRQLEQLGIHDWFQTLVASEDTERHKPEPDVFLEAAKRLRVAPDRCLVFEDAVLGFQAASAAGMRCVQVLREEAVRPAPNC